MGTWLPFLQAAAALMFFIRGTVSEATVRRSTEGAGAAYEVALEEGFASYSATIWGGIALAEDGADAANIAIHGDISRGIDKRFWVKAFRFPFIKEMSNLSQS